MALKRACQVHDQVNLALLPLISGLAIAGYCGLISSSFVTQMLTLYIVIDLVWIVLVPDAVPSLSGVIMAHHCVTLLLLVFPLRYPEFGSFACLDGMVELNTFFLIARRQWPSWASLHTTLYWCSFVPMRMVLYPYLLLPFSHALASHPLLERVACLGAQALLCLFNFGLLHTHMQSWRRRRQRALAAKEAAAAAAPAPPAQQIQDDEEMAEALPRQQQRRPMAGPASLARRLAQAGRVPFQADGRIRVALQPRIHA